MKNLQKSPIIFECVDCDYKCCKKSEWSKHLLTRKHELRTELNKKSPNSSHMNCRLCNKEYKVRNSLWYHEKKCTGPRPEEKNQDFMVELIQQNQELISKQTETLKQNQELQCQIIELSKERTITHNTNTQFNLNFYLNETCKNAKNYSDFIKSLEFDQHDLERVIRDGYVNGHTALIQQQFEKLEIHERPIQCSDLKRGVTHIKNDNIWHTDGPEMTYIKKLTDLVTYKTMQQYCQWAKDHPGPISEEIENEEKFLDAKKKHMDLQFFVMAQINGIGNDIEKNNKEIHKNVIKMVTIDKTKERL